MYLKLGNKNQNKREKICDLENEIFLKWNTKIFLWRVLGLLHFGFYHNCMIIVNLVEEIQLKSFNKEF